MSRSTPALRAFSFDLRRLTVAAALLAPTAAAAQTDPNERFNAVKDWFGSLDITVTGDGSLTSPTGSTTYRVRKHLAYTFQLAPLAPGQTEGPYFTWTTCATSTSLGTIDHEVVYRTTNGCELTVHGEASGVLDPVPPSPFPDPEGPACVINAFQLQILPLPGGGTYTSWGFADSIAGTETTLDACLGTEFTAAHTSRFLEPSAKPICQGPDCLQLPATGLEIVNTWSFDEDLSGIGPGAPVHLEVVLRLQACANEPELVVEIDDHESWRPRGSDSELEEGNVLRCRAVLQARGGCPTPLRARRFTFELLDVSSEPGICMNYPLFVPPRTPTGLPDLGFLVRNNPAPWLPAGDPAFVLESADGSYSESPPAVISSFDWGGHARLRVTAELTDGRSVVGHLAGDEAAVSIPVPRRRAGSKIADGWRQLQGVDALADEDDGETAPEGDGHRGDGLTLYEEYRGFYPRSAGNHLEGNPKKKDIFVVDEAAARAGIQLFASATGLEVHGELLLGALDPNRLINPNRSAAVAGAVDQHGVYLFRRQLEAGVGGIANGGPGLPKHVRWIAINKTIRPKWVLGFVAGHASLVTFEMQTIAHEFLHSSNVYHHGRGDRRRVQWSVEDTGGGHFVYKEGGRVIHVNREGECGAFDEHLPAGPNAAFTTGVYVGTRGGEHSGNEDCLMRYNIATVYEDDVLLDSYWFFSGEESPGFLLCGSSRGTGANAPSHCPQSRYGAATVGCCRAQLCVSDRQDHAAGSPPSSCPGGGGGAEGVLPAAAAAPPVSPQPVVSLAVEEEVAPTVLRGEPILVTFHVAASRLGAEEPGEELVLSPGPGAWTTAIRFELVRDGAPVAPWPLVPLGPAPDELRLDERASGLAAWWIAPAASAAIEPGVYTLTATLDTRGEAAGWQGLAAALPVTVTVASPPANPDAAARARSALLLARYRVGEGRLEESLALLDALLVNQPDIVEAHWFRAQVLDALGDASAALEASSRALELFEAAAEGDEVPAQLLREHNDLIARALAGPAAPRFRRGDANADGENNIADAVFSLGWQFLGTTTPVCIDAADTNDDGAINLSDPIALLGYLYLGTAAPPAPGPRVCGTDPTADTLPDCAALAPPCGE